jgi:ESF2/ABP1 family protein
MKYLPSFQWNHLTEKVAYERRVREQKLRLETLQAQRNVQKYRQLIETDQKLDYIAERRRGNDTEENATKKAKRSFHQVQPIMAEVTKGTSASSSNAVLNSLLR